MSNLVPCPKCGGQPFFGSATVFSGPVPGNIGCFPCFLSPNDFHIYPSHEEAIAAWNKFAREEGKT